MSNRIYETLDSEYSILIMQCFVGPEKKRLNETLVFVYSKAYFVRLGPSVRLEENDNFLIKFYLQANSL